MTLARIVFAVAALAAFPLAADDHMKPSRAAQAVMGDEEKDFFETAASANMLEVEAGKLAAAQGTDPSVRQYGERMVTDHTKATEELQALAQKKGVTLPKQMLKRHQAMYQDLSEEKKGKDFDQEFKKHMVVSHKEAVSLFDQTARKAKDPEVKAFAEKTLPILQAHGGDARKLGEHDAHRN